jgi:signal peptidase I
MDPETQNRDTENQNSAPLKELGAFFWDLIKIVAIALAIIIPFRTLVAEPFVVSGTSMLPNFHNKDYLIIDRLSYKFSQPARGDVIVLRYPKDLSQYFIKRIVGLPGDKIQIKQGRVFVYSSQNPQGVELNESYLPQTTETLGRSDIVNLGSDEYFVLGDNRLASSDSRDWGILPKGDIVGKVWLRVFPLNSFGSPVSANPLSFNFQLKW